MAVYKFRDHVPQWDPVTSYIAESASVIGNCNLGKSVSVWPGAVLRGDNATITVGEGCNVQDNAVIHTDPGYPVVLEPNVSIGHMAMVHGATIGENSLIGMQAVVLNGAKIGKNCIIGANSVIGQNKEIPDNSLVVGQSVIKRPTTDKEVNYVLSIAFGYQEKALEYQKLERVDVKLV
jgi:carbonic anhydrase/acetyltransferase-like protein (isoleucine patch superfamily)